MNPTIHYPDLSPRDPKDAQLSNFKKLVANEDAQSLAEAAVLVGLIAVVAIVALTVLGEGTQSIFSHIATTLRR